MKTRVRRGFTLPEVLVTVTVVAVLAAVVVPAVTQYVNRGNNPATQQDIISHSANWHLVPATDVVWGQLDRLRVGDVVKLEGMLVNLENPGVGTMTTSLRRDDSGAGACEIIYVEKASIRKD